MNEFLQDCLSGLIAGCVVSILIVIGVSVGIPLELCSTLGFATLALWWSSRFGPSFLGRLAFRKGKYEACIRICETGMKLRPKYNYHYRLCAAASQRLGDYARAYEYASDAIAIGGNYTEWSYALRANSDLMMANYEQCISDIDNSLRLGKTDVDVHILKIAALTALHQYETAIDYLEENKQNCKNSQMVTLYRALIFNHMNQHQLAKKECDKLFESVSARQVGLALLVQATIDTDLGNIEPAIDGMNTAIELNPDDRNYYVNRAYILSRAGRLAEAFEDIKHADTLEKKTLSRGILESNLARLNLITNELQRALALTKTAIKEAPTNSAILGTHGLMLLRNGIFDEAQRTLDKAIEIDKYNAEAYYFRAELHEKMGNIEEAEKDKKIALDFSYIPYL
jgi:tetratricopeptide (TPR) repeat protein